jgi:hypothetical protein
MISSEHACGCHGPRHAPSIILAMPSVKDVESIVDTEASV